MQHQAHYGKDTQHQCFFRLKRKKLNFFVSAIFFRLTLIFLAHFREFFSKSTKNKGKIVLEAQNTENFRLRRAEMKENITNLTQNGFNLAKFAPEGRDFFEMIFFRFAKTKK